MKCPLCAGESRQLFEKHGCWIRQCVSCGHQFAEVGDVTDHVERVYGDAYFQGGGAGYTDYLAEADLLRQRGHYYARKVARHRSPGRLLDIGAAAGYLLQGFIDQGWNGQGIEPNDRMADHARMQLRLDVRTGTLEQFTPDGVFDLVLMSQVIAHFVDPCKAVERARALLAAEGMLLIETWDRGSWTARFGGQNWHEYSPPSVLHWFTRSGLRAFVERYGLREIASGRPAKWISAGHARSLLQHSSGSLLGKVAGTMLRVLPEKMALPYPAEDLFWALFKAR